MKDDPANDRTIRVRRWSSKTRTGCRTCRSRRVKCDERRPHCLKCSSTGRNCNGYEVASTSSTSTDQRPRLLPRETTTHLAIRTPHAVLQQLPSLLDDGDMQGFNLFRRDVARSLAGQFSSDVWEYYVPQLSHQQPAVLHAAIATGCLYQCRRNLVQSTKINIVETRKQYYLSLTHYSKAVSTLRTLMVDSTKVEKYELLSVILISCLLFVAFETLQGDQKSALDHLLQGLHLLSDHAKQEVVMHLGYRAVSPGAPNEATIDKLFEVFVRLDTDATMFGQRMPSLRHTTHNGSTHTSISVPKSFETLHQAKLHLDLLTNAVFSFRGELLDLAEKQRTDTAHHDSEDWPKRYCRLYADARRINLDIQPCLAAQKETLILGFAAWSCALKRFDSCSNRMAMVLLEIQCLFPWIVISTFQDSQEELCDRFNDSFARVVDLGTEYVEALSNDEATRHFSFIQEPGVIPTLYLVAAKCRLSPVRRRAVELLRDAPIQEGLWNGKLFAKYCERLMDIEENQAKALLGIEDEPTDIPEAARFADAVIWADPETPGVGRLICSRRNDQFEGGIEIVDHQFDLLC